MTQYQESLPQSIVNINQSSSNISRGFYLVKRLDVLTIFFTNRFEELKKDLDHAKKCGNKELYLEIGRQIIEIQSQLYGVVKEKIIVARQLQQMITINESKMVAALKGEIEQAEKLQKRGGNDDQVSLRRKKRIKEKKVESKGLAPDKGITIESGNSSSALTSDSS